MKYGYAHARIKGPGMKSRRRAIIANQDSNIGEYSVPG